MMSLRNQAISGMMWTYSQQFGVQALQFGVSVVLARLITPGEFGLIGMIAIFIGLGNILFDGGLTTSLIRTKNVSDVDYSTVFFFNLIGSIFIYIILFIAAPYISFFFKQAILKDLLRIYSVTFIISSLSAVQNAKLTKELKFKLLAIAAVPGIILGSIAGIFIAYKGYGVWALVYSYLIQSLSTTVFLWSVSKWRPSFLFSKIKFKEHFYFGSKMTISGVLDVIFVNLYQLVIGKFYAPAQVGFYTRANSLMMLPVGNISTALNKVVFPLFSQLQDDIKRLRDIYRRVMLVVIFVISPIVALMAVLIKPLVLLLFGSVWLPVVPIFQIIALNGILYPLHVYNLLILQIRGKSGLFLKLEIAKKLLNIILIMLTISSGLYTLLWGLVIFSVLALVINTYYAGKELEYSGLQQMRDLFPIFAITIAMCIVVYFVDLLMADYADLYKLIVGCFSGVLFYLVISTIFKFQSMAELINLIKRK